MIYNFFISLFTPSMSMTSQMPKRKTKSSVTVGNKVTTTFRLVHFLYYLYCSYLQSCCKDNPYESFKYMDCMYELWGFPSFEYFFLSLNYMQSVFFVNFVYFLSYKYCKYSQLVPDRSARLVLSCFNSRLSRTL